MNDSYEEYGEDPEVASRREEYIWAMQERIIAACRGELGQPRRVHFTQADKEFLASLRISTT